nr:MAG TPA: hypothetical protein [Caudoviricetes sp.]
MGTIALTVMWGWSFFVCIIILKILFNPVIVNN